MKKFSRNLLIISIIVFAVGAVALVASANHSWGSYHWARTSNPFTLKLGDNVSTAWDVYLNTASSQWSESSVLDTTIIAGGTNNTKGRLTPKNCVPTSGRIEVCNAKYGSTGWLGIAQIWISGDHIVQGITKLNDTYFNTSYYNNAGWKGLVLCQEVGHDFGLDHQNEDFNDEPIVEHTCMDYFVPSASEVVGPNVHDYEQLETMYGHLDSTATATLSEPSKGNSVEVDLDNPAEWGKSLKQDSQGKDNLFVRDLGNGRKVFTHVFWAQ